MDKHALSQEPLKSSIMLKKGIISRFRWLDRIENVNMPLLYSLVSERGGVNLVTSHCESFGMSVLESLLTGCPVVSTNVGALPEILNSLNITNYTN